jgi:hypothetical protein
MCARANPRTLRPCDDARTSAQRGALSRGVSMVRAGGRIRAALPRVLRSMWPVGSLAGAAERKAGYGAGRPCQHGLPDYIRARRRTPRSLGFSKLTSDEAERQEETARVPMEGRLELRPGAHLRAELAALAKRRTCQLSSPRQGGDPDHVFTKIGRPHQSAEAHLCCAVHQVSACARMALEDAERGQPRHERCCSKGAAVIL